MFALSEKFGWTPKQIKELDKTDRDAYLLFMKGVSDGKPTKK